MREIGAGGPSGPGAGGRAGPVSGCVDTWRQLGLAEAERTEHFRHPLARALWPWLIALELGLAYQWRVRWSLLHGDVVVTDRYVLSALTDLGVRLGQPDIGRLPAGQLLRWLAPRPRHSFWLDVPPTLALARKNGQESFDVLRKQAQYAPILAAELGATRLDATAPLGDLSDRLVTDVLRSYFDAHHTVLNAFFFANPQRLPKDWQERTDA